MSRSGPPVVAVWMLRLFAPEESADFVAGDLLEEFGEIAAGRGLRAARWWYWSQTVKSCLALLGREFRTAPWSTVGMGAGGLLLLALVKMISDWAVGMVLLAWAEGIYARVGASAFWAAYHFAILGGAEPMMVGWLAAVVGRRRGMLVPVAMSLLAAVAIVRFYMRGPRGVPIGFGYLDAVPIGILLGGVLGRISRARKRSVPA